MLLGIRFLDGYYGSKDGYLQDWPPSPARVFAALTNAFYNYKNNDNNINTDVLLWLENQAPPDIYYATQLETKNNPTVFVPRNSYEKEESFLYPFRQERKFHSVHTETPYIYYDWVGIQPHPEIKNIVNYLHQLGTSRSMAISKILDSFPENIKDYQHITPVKNKDEDEIDFSLSCYYPGSLEISEFIYQGNKIESPINYVCYQKVKPKPISLFKENIVLRLDGPYNIKNTHTALIADAIRNKLLSIAGELNLKPNALIGKIHGNHMAFLPLSFVGKYGDGSIKGISISIPNIEEQELKECKEIIKRFIASGGHFKYKDEDWKLKVLEGDIIETLKIKNWAKPSTTWQTVIPAEINRRTEPDKFVYQLCEKLGLPVKSVHSQPHPFFNGVGHFKDYFKRNIIKQNRNSGFLTHLEIEFHQPINGPFSIGKTSNFGFGIMKPVREPRS